MNLDIRTPIGLLFVSLGGLLVIYGFFSDPGIYVRSLNININLWWGLALLVFGSIMTYFGRRKTKLRPSSTR
jgi:hypothetical protein